MITLADHLRVYIAASSRELSRVDAAADALAAVPNIQIAYRWWDDMRAAGKPDDALSRDEARVAAAKCLRGVADCTLFWLLYPGEPTRGAWVELGYFQGLPITTHLREMVVSYPHAPAARDADEGACIFARGDWPAYHTDEAAFRHIRAIAEGLLV